MIFFSNERSFLDWMKVSTTLGIIAIGISFISGASAHPDARWIATRALSLLLLLIAILLSCSAYFLFRRREKFIHDLRETSECYSNVWMPRFLTLAGVSFMTFVWITTLIRLYNNAS